MPWPLPTPEQIADRASSVYEQTFPGIDARSANSLASTNARITGMSTFDLYLYQTYLAQELMPDTANDWLPRHADIWGVPQDQPTAAAGNMLFTSTGGAVVVPANTGLFATSGVIVLTQADATVPAGGSLLVAVTASEPGSQGNQPGGTVFTLIGAPLPGLNPQGGTLDSNGLTGGLDLEGIEAWRWRILDRIRLPPDGGAPDDYVTWAKASMPNVQYVSVQPNWGGLGNVGVIFAMSGPATPTTTEISALLTYLSVPSRKPVCATPVVLGATLMPVPVSIALNPDTPATRAAATNALNLFFTQDAAIGGTVYMSRLDNALSSASGEYSHERTLPAADVVMSATEIATLGPVTFL
jgi:uncharacterized phage protein gp47/JayE